MEEQMPFQRDLQGDYWATQHGSKEKGLSGLNCVGAQLSVHVLFIILVPKQQSHSKLLF